MLTGLLLRRGALRGVPAFQAPALLPRLSSSLAGTPGPTTTLGAGRNLASLLPARARSQGGLLSLPWARGAGVETLLGGVRGVKTSSSAKKRFRIMGNGRIKRWQSGKRHINSKRNRKHIRRLGDSKMLKGFQIKYAKKLLGGRR